MSAIKLTFQTYLLSGKALANWMWHSVMRSVNMFVCKNQEKLYARHQMGWLDKNTTHWMVVFQERLKSANRRRGRRMELKFLHLPNLPHSIGSRVNLYDWSHLQLHHISSLGSIIQNSRGNVRLLPSYQESWIRSPRIWLHLKLGKKSSTLCILHDREPRTWAREDTRIASPFPSRLLSKGFHAPQIHNGLKIFANHGTRSYDLDTKEPSAWLRPLHFVDVIRSQHEVHLQPGTTPYSVRLQQRPLPRRTAKL